MGTFADAVKKFTKGTRLTYGVILLLFVIAFPTLFFVSRKNVSAPSLWRDGEHLAASSTPDAPPSFNIYLPIPDEVRGLYLNAGNAGSARGRESLAFMIDRGLNTVVIDLKTDDGSIAFVPHDDALLPYALAKPAIADLDELLRTYAETSIYKIARIAVMRDRVYAERNPSSALYHKGGGLWHDRSGFPWLDPAAPAVAEYAVILGKEAYARGFDEIQYDYVRFPSDGVLGTIRYPYSTLAHEKSAIMAAFFEHVGGALQQEGVPVSFDLFGLTMVASDGIGIGQRAVDVLPFTDFISPMVYPSHYAPGFRGHANPALHPYDVVKSSLDAGIAQLVAAGIPDASARRMIRPWLQDFDIGAVYTATMIEEQIRAARDAGASGWMLWNARNVYEPAEYLPSIAPASTL